MSDSDDFDDPICDGEDGDVLTGLYFLAIIVAAIALAVWGTFQ